MNILDNLKILQNIKSLEDLKSKYDFAKLNELRVVVVNLIKETDTEFKKEIGGNDISKDLLLKLWNSKTNLEKLNELIFKSLSAFERDELIQQTSLLTSKISDIVKNIEKAN